MARHSIRFEFIEMRSWPVLAWLARCPRGSDIVTVLHGSRVDSTQEWYCEAVWAGRFGEGDFDRTDIIAGTGGRLRDGEVVFVSSGSTVDRLQSIEMPDGPWVSNSLTCLVAAANPRIDEGSGTYFRFFRTIVRGIGRYHRQLPTSAPPITLTYFDNLVWNGQRLQTRRKPRLGRDFGSFPRYATFLESSMQAVAENSRTALRKQPFELLSTASSGYDSSTVTVLAKAAGARQVLCFDQARRGRYDSGEPLARALGLEAITVRRSAWMDVALPEVPFLASDSHGGDVFFRGAERVLDGKVLLTGYHGDKVWAKDGHSALDEQIIRGDQSGLSLTEYRLTIGMVHCPVAFWGVRQIADIHAISNSAEMKPWDVPGDYSRPICRRLVETAGVPRELFGMEKKASWVQLHRSDRFLSSTSLPDYLQWLKDRRWVWLRHGRIPPVVNCEIDKLEMQFRSAAGQLGMADPPTWYKAALRRTGVMRVVWRVSETPTRLRRYVFPWALEHHRRKYAPPF